MMALPVRVVSTAVDWFAARGIRLYPASHGQVSFRCPKCKVGWISVHNNGRFCDWGNPDCGVSGESWSDWEKFWVEYNVAAFNFRGGAP